MWPYSPLRYTMFQSRVYNGLLATTQPGHTWSVLLSILTTLTSLFKQYLVGRRYNVHMKHYLVLIHVVYSVLLTLFQEQSTTQHYHISTDMLHGLEVHGEATVATGTTSLLCSSIMPRRGRREAVYDPKVGGYRVVIRDVMSQKRETTRQLVVLAITLTCCSSLNR